MTAPSEPGRWTRRGAALATGAVLFVAITVAGVHDMSKRSGAEPAELYAARCAACHEIEGATGGPLDPRVLASYGTARRLFNYVRLAMPYDAPRTLPDEEYWLTVEHLLRSRGLVGDDIDVTRETADWLVLEGDR